MAICKKMFAVLVMFAAINLCLAKPKWMWKRDQEADGLNVETNLRQHRGVELDGFLDENTKPCDFSNRRLCTKRMLM